MDGQRIDSEGLSHPEVQLCLQEEVGMITPGSLPPAGPSQQVRLWIELAGFYFAPLGCGSFRLCPGLNLFWPSPCLHPLFGDTSLPAVA